MANKSNQFLLPNSSFQKFFENFFEAYEKKKLFDKYDITCSAERSHLLSESDKKVKEFDLKYPVPETLKFVQQYMDVTGEFAMSSEPSSSFQVVCNIMDQMAAKYGSSLEKDLPQAWKQLISIVATDESSPNTHAFHRSSELQEPQRKGLQEVLVCRTSDANFQKQTPLTEMP